MPKTNPADHPTPEEVWDYLHGTGWKYHPNLFPKEFERLRKGDRVLRSGGSDEFGQIQECVVKKHRPPYRPVLEVVRVIWQGESMHTKKGDTIEGFREEVYRWIW